MKQTTKIWLISLGTILVGISGYLYFKKKKNSPFGQPFLPPDKNPDRTGSPNATNADAHPGKFRCSSTTYPLNYGTCHKDVAILQEYLKKVFNANLGNYGPNRDGVDAKFGSTTLLAAQKHLNRSAFSKPQIQGLRASLKYIIQ